MNAEQFTRMMNELNGIFAQLQQGNQGAQQAAQTATQKTRHYLPRYKPKYNRHNKLQKLLSQQFKVAHNNHFHQRNLQDLQGNQIPETWSITQQLPASSYGLSLLLL